MKSEVIKKQMRLIENQIRELEASMARETTDEFRAHTLGTIEIYKKSLAEYQTMLDKMPNAAA